MCDTNIKIASFCAFYLWVDNYFPFGFWYSRRESNPQRPLRRGLLYPFNYGSILNFIARGRNDCRKKFYTKIYTNFFPPREK